MSLEVVVYSLKYLAHSWQNSVALITTCAAFLFPGSRKLGELSKRNETWLLQCTFFSALWKTSYEIIFFFYIYWVKGFFCVCLRCLFVFVIDFIKQIETNQTTYIRRSVNIDPFFTFTDNDNERNVKKFFNDKQQRLYFWVEGEQICNFY